MEEYSAIISSLSISLTSYLPITVIVAIALFLLRQITDIFRKHRARRNKIIAISYLLAEETKLNHWALKKLFEAYKQLAYLFEKHQDALYRVRQSRFGNYSFEYKETTSDSVWSGQSLPIFVSNQFNNLLPSLAELDVKLAKKVQELYEVIAELEHYRQTLVLFVTDELHEEEVFKDLTRNFISDFSQEEKDYFSLVEKGYKAMSGNDLEDFRLR